MKTPSSQARRPRQPLLPLDWTTDGEAKLDHGGVLSDSDPGSLSGTKGIVPGDSGANALRRECLRGPNPALVLERLVRGDPLGVRDLVKTRLARRALILDPDRVYLRSLARCARYANGLRPRASIGKWVAGHVDAAIDELLGSEARLDPLPADPAPSVFAQLARPLDLDPDRARRACVAFNGCSHGDRRAFFDVFLRGIPLDHVAAELGVSASELARRARTALDASIRAIVNEPADDLEEGPRRRGG